MIMRDSRGHFFAVDETESTYADSTDFNRVDQHQFIAEDECDLNTIADTEPTELHLGVE